MIRYLNITLCSATNTGHFIHTENCLTLTGRGLEMDSESFRLQIFHVIERNNIF